MELDHTKQDEFSNLANTFITELVKADYSLSDTEFLFDYIKSQMAGMALKPKPHKEVEDHNERYRKIVVKEPHGHAMTLIFGDPHMIHTIIDTDDNYFVVEIEDSYGFYTTENGKGFSKKESLI
ncbi:hypothetical protein [Lentilactobacillus kisonensis]|uniref:hypothetical protein n=1 Tax=Lentilactobacillus kisonensis TaxID=481722 RepID=UPI0006CFB6CB|nr:hypothetical protein [Lentilactobacillus kisonensis]